MTQPPRDTERQWHDALAELDQAQASIRRAHEAIRRLRSEHSALTPPVVEPYRPPVPLPDAAPAPVFPVPQQHSAFTRVRRGPFPKWRTLSTEQVILRLIAVAGIAITVLGVSFAVAVAIQTGLLGPLGRVLLAAVLAAVLLAAAVALERRGGQPVGVAALALTSLLTSVLLVLSLVGVLAWWTPEVGAVAFVGVWSLYLFLYRAAEWRALGFALAVLSLGLALAYPAMVEHAATATLVAALPLFTLAATWDEVDRLPRRAALFASASSSLGLTTYSAGVNLPGFALPLMLLALLGAILIVAVALRSPVTDTDKHGYAATMVVISLLAAVIDAPNPWISYVATVVIIGCFVFAATRHLTAGLLPTVLGVLIPLSLLAPWARLVATDDVGRLTPGTDISHALLLLGLIIFIALCIRRRAAGAPEWAAWLVTVCLSSFPLFAASAGETPMVFSSTSAAAAGIVLGAIVGVVGVNYRTLASLPKPLQWGSGLAGLALTMISTTSIAVWVSFVLGGPSAMETGYLTGHALVSTGWMVLAALVLLGLTPVHEDAALWVGAVLAAAAVVKLVFFDLQALTGVARALAFLASGLVLLVIVSLRARRTARTAVPAASVVAEPSRETEPPRG